VAALTRLRRLEKRVARNAFGFALAFAAGTMQAHLEGKPALAIQVAAAARSALQAVDLACAGLEAAHAAIEGPFGYLALFETRSELEPVLRTLGKEFRIAQVSCKPFPTGRAAHGAIVATRELMREHGVTAATLETLEYRAPPLIKRLVGRPIMKHMEPAYARLCFQYLGALVLTRGTVGLGDFTRTRLDDPELHEIAQRIRVKENDNPDPAAFAPAQAIATLRDGSRKVVAVTSQLGSPARPLSYVEHRAKARSCLEFAGFGAIDASLAAAVETFETARDASIAVRLACSGQS
jgi:2-methylcitrate dehydratase PrpD